MKRKERKERQEGTEEKEAEKKRDRRKLKEATLCSFNSWTEYFGNALKEACQFS